MAHQNPKPPPTGVDMMKYSLTGKFFWGGEIKSDKLVIHVSSFGEPGQGPVPHDTFSVFPGECLTRFQVYEEPQGIYFYKLKKIEPKADNPNEYHMILQEWNKETLEWNKEKLTEHDVFRFFYFMPIKTVCPTKEYDVELGAWGIRKVPRQPADNQNDQNDEKDEKENNQPNKPNVAQNKNVDKALREYDDFMRYDGDLSGFANHQYYDDHANELDVDNQRSGGYHAYDHYQHDLVPYQSDNSFLHGPLGIIAVLTGLVFVLCCLCIACLLGAGSASCLFRVARRKLVARKRSVRFDDHMSDSQI